MAGAFRVEVSCRRFHLRRQIISSLAVIFLIGLIFAIWKCLFRFLSAFMRGVHEFVVDTVIELAIVVDLVLSILVAASGSKLNQRFLLDHRCLFPVYFFEFAVVAHRAVEGSEDHRLGRRISQGRIHRVKVELGETVPGLFVWILRDFISVEARWVVICKLSSYNLLLFLIENNKFIWGVLHPRVAENLLNSKTAHWIRLQ